MKAGKTSGERNDNYTPTLAQIGICNEEIRRIRCEHEPECRDTNCLRNAQNDFYYKTLEL